MSHDQCHDISAPPPPKCMLRGSKLHINYKFFPMFPSFFSHASLPFLTKFEFNKMTVSTPRRFIRRPSAVDFFDKTNDNYDNPKPTGNTMNESHKRSGETMNKRNDSPKASGMTMTERNYSPKGQITNENVLNPNDSRMVMCESYHTSNGSRMTMGKNDRISRESTIIMNENEIPTASRITPNKGHVSNVSRATPNKGHVSNASRATPNEGHGSRAIPKTPLLKREVSKALPMKVFKPKKQADYRSAFVGNLDPSTTANDLARIFSDLTPIKPITIIRPGGAAYAYLEFRDAHTMRKATRFNGVVVRSCEIIVTPKEVTQYVLEELDRQELDYHEQSHHKQGCHELGHHEYDRHELGRHELGRHEYDRHEIGRREYDHHKLSRHEYDRHEYNRHEHNRHEQNRHGYDHRHKHGHGHRYGRGSGRGYCRKEQALGREQAYFQGRGNVLSRLAKRAPLKDVTNFDQY